MIDFPSYSGFPPKGTVVQLFVNSAAFDRVLCLSATKQTPTLPTATSLRKSSRMFNGVDKKANIKLIYYLFGTSRIVGIWQGKPVSLTNKEILELIIVSFSVLEKISKT